VQQSGTLKSANISACGLKCSLGKVKAVRGFEYALSSNDRSDCLHCNLRWSLNGKWNDRHIYFRLDERLFTSDPPLPSLGCDDGMGVIFSVLKVRDYLSLSPRIEN
jgi:hypothetical protein